MTSSRRTGGNLCTMMPRERPRIVAAAFKRQHLAAVAARVIDRALQLGEASSKNGLPAERWGFQRHTI